MLVGRRALVKANVVHSSLMLLYDKTEQLQVSFSVLRGTLLRNVQILNFPPNTGNNFDFNGWCYCSVD